MFTKCIIVVDEDCDVQDIGEVVLRVTNNIDPERDIQFTLGPVDSLDHASRLPNLRVEDGHRRDPQVEGRGIRAALAADARDGHGDEGARGRDLGEAGAVKAGTEGTRNEERTNNRRGNKGAGALRGRCSRSKGGCEEGDRAARSAGLL